MRLNSWPALQQSSTASRCKLDSELYSTSAQHKMLKVEGPCEDDCLCSIKVTIAITYLGNTKKSVFK